MNFFNPRLIIAGCVALLADLIQFILLPITVVGFLDPINDIIDFAVAGILVSLLGFHWALLPAVMGKLMPVADVAPFWTASVFVVGVTQNMGHHIPGVPGMAPMPDYNQPQAIPEHEQGPTLTIPAQSETTQR